MSYNKVKQLHTNYQNYFPNLKILLTVFYYLVKSLKLCCLRQNIVVGVEILYSLLNIYFVYFVFTFKLLNSCWLILLHEK